MKKTIIIAEIGECFNGDMGTAKKLMRVAKNAGCDIVKFQTLDYEVISENDPEKEWFKKIALTPQAIAYLIKYSKAIGIKTLFTPENIKTAGWLFCAGLKDVKIASSSITDYALIKFINAHFKRVFISTGMASLKEIHKAINYLKRIKELYIMHCVSEYPTGPLLKARGLKALSLEDARLNMMKMLMEKYPRHTVGYSDHSVEIITAVAAVAMGAKVIEKHITLDRLTPLESFKKKTGYLGTDHVLSLEPDELAEMVKQIRQVDKMLGPKVWGRSKAEILLKAFLRNRFKNE